MELSSSNIKKFLTFWYISGNGTFLHGNPKKLLVFQEVTFRAPKIKRAHS